MTVLTILTVWSMKRSIRSKRSDQKIIKRKEINYLAMAKVIGLSLVLYFASRSHYCGRFAFYYTYNLHIWDFFVPMRRSRRKQRELPDIDVRINTGGYFF